MLKTDKKKIKKILIFRFGAIGDVVHTTPLFRSLKNHDLSLSIHYLTSKIPSLLIENDPDLDKVWVLEEKSYKYLRKLAKTLEKENFDLIINLHPSIRTRIFTMWINARHTLVYKKTFKIHAVENFWQTAKPLFKNMYLDREIKLYIPDNTKQKVSKLVNISKKIIGLNPGVSAARQGRLWPMEYWQELARTLADKYNCEIVITGSDNEIEIAKMLTDISPAIKSFCGQLSIVESAAMLSRCDLVISPDTGPLHISTAVGAPVIGLYGAAPISRTGPIGKTAYTLKSDRKCVPCNRRRCKYQKKDENCAPCMKDITPNQVLKIIEDNLKLF